MSGSLESELDGDGDALPLSGLDVELSSAGGGELVVLGAAVVFGRPPAGGKPAGCLETVERGEERSGPDIEGAARDLLDAAGDAKPVQLAESKRFEDQEVERPLKQIGLRGGHRVLSN